MTNFYFNNPGHGIFSPQVEVMYGKIVVQLLPLNNESNYQDALLFIDHLLEIRGCKEKVFYTIPGGVGQAEWYTNFDSKDYDYVPIKFINAPYKQSMEGYHINRHVFYKEEDGPTKIELPRPVNSFVDVEISSANVPLTPIFRQVIIAMTRVDNTLNYSQNDLAKFLREIDK